MDDSRLIDRDSPVIAAVPIRRLTVAQYHAMIDAGILTEDDDLELLEGWLVEKMTKNPQHVTTAELIAEAWRAILPTGWFVRQQDPVTTTDSEPEPDVMIVRGAIRDYRDRHPAPQEIGLVVEVADSTLRTDRQWKARIYARAGIPVYWIADVNGLQIEVLSAPAGVAEAASYTIRVVYDMGEAIPLVLEGQEIGRVSVDAVMA
ncbi:MAG: Uma2 family endonuclease [Anaerolineae bacterium]|nr:Uma2 family endonuclease [Anaerolineae bacterium]NUQ05545.1 Uma2 family endonuclease [Anaerolineae bacterium]